MRVFHLFLYSSFVFRACLAALYYGLMLEQHAESAWEQQFNMRVDVITRMASSLANSGRTPVEPIMRFAVQNSSWWEQENKSLSIDEFKDLSVINEFNQSFLGVVEHSLGEFFDIPYLDSVLPTGFVSHDVWTERCERQMYSDPSLNLEPRLYCVIHKVLWATRGTDLSKHRCQPGFNFVLTSGLDLKFLARKVVCVDYQQMTTEQLQILLSDRSEGTVAFYRWDHLSGSYGEPNHIAFRFNQATLAAPLNILESISKCTELDDSACDSCVVNRGHHFCDVAAFHWRRGDRHSSPTFLPAFTEYMLTNPLQASHFVKAELTKRNISVLFLATNSGRMDQVHLLTERLRPIVVFSTIFGSSEWETAIVRAVSDMVVASQAGFFIMGPGLRGSHSEGVSTYSRRIMLQRIHHMGRTDASHYTVCCGDLTSISIFTPKNGAVYWASDSSPTEVTVEAVILNPLNGSQVYARLENSLDNESSVSLMSILPGTGRTIQSGRTLDPNEPDNIAHLWHTRFLVNGHGKFRMLASAITFFPYNIFLIFIFIRLTVTIGSGLQRSRKSC